MAVAQITAGVPQALSEWYDRKLIQFERPKLRMMQGAQMRPMPRNNGKVAYFTGFRPTVRPSSALTEGSSPTAVGLGARQISATVAEWGQTLKFSTLIDVTKIDPGLTEQVAIVGDNRGRTLDYQLTKEVARNGVWGQTVAGVTTNIQTVTVSSVSGTNTTSVFVTTVATTLNAVSATSWVGAIATVVSDCPDDGTSDLGYTTVKYGYGGRVLTVAHSLTAGDTVTLNTTAPNAAAPEQFQSNDRVRLVALSNITASTNLSNTSFAMAQRDLIGNHATSFGDGFYMAVIPSATLYSLKLDTTWVNAASYSNIRSLYRGEVGTWYGMRVLEGTQPYREGTTGTESESAGLVYHNFFFGANAFGHTELSGIGNGIHIVRGPDTNEPIPRNTYVSWSQNFAQKALTAPHCVDFVAGAAA